MDTVHPSPHSDVRDVRDVRTRLTNDERAELSWLRSVNTLQRVERDILLRIATGYAHDVDTMLRVRKTNTFHQG